MTKDKAPEAALLACPFCGGAPEEHWPNSTTKHFIQCGGCGARTSINLASHGGSARDGWNRRAPLPAVLREVEVVEHMACGDCHGSGYGGHPDSGIVCSTCDGAGGIPLVALTSYQAMQARAEAAERERDAFRDMADGYGKLDADLAIAEARVKELEEALKPFAFNGLRTDLSRFDEETGIEVHFPRTSPRKAIPAARIHVEDVLRARTALTGGSNG